MYMPDMDDPHYSDLHNAYFWYDEIGDVQGPFSTYKKAKKARDAYAYWLDHGPTLWQRFWWPIRWGFLARFTERLSSPGQPE